MSTVYVRVRVTSEHYALAVEDVLEVAEVGDVTPMPGAPPAVLGVRNLRGQVLPVIDLATILGLPRDAPPPRLVVGDHGGERAGLAVDELVDVGELPELSASADSRLLHGATLVDGVPVGVLDLAAVLREVSATELQP